MMCLLQNPSFRGHNKALSKTFWEKEELLVPSIFLFLPTIFSTQKEQMPSLEPYLDFRLLCAGAFSLDQSKISSYGTGLTLYHTILTFNPLPHIPVLGSSNSAANKDMMAKIWTHGDTINCLSKKHCGKRRNCSLQAISPFPTMFSKAVCC